MYRTLPALALFLAVHASAEAQVQDFSPFRALDLPAANEMRTGSGRPGPRYWQQRADYRIQATLDVEKGELSGEETIRYGNNSPSALPYVWLTVLMMVFIFIFPSIVTTFVPD